MDFKRFFFKYTINANLLQVINYQKPFSTYIFYVWNKLTEKVELFLSLTRINCMEKNLLKIDISYFIIAILTFILVIWPKNLIDASSTLEAKQKSDFNIKSFHFFCFFTIMSLKNLISFFFKFKKATSLDH